jgi:hypothetical protein
MAEELGRLVIHANRGGTIGEITTFLSDLEAAYDALYRLDTAGRGLRRYSRIVPLEFLSELGYALIPLNQQTLAIPPGDRLILDRVRIESPGFWEFLGSLNPLQQLREYLNDRHKRRQDREFREAAEKERLMLENELIRGQIYEKENSVIRERIAIFRELGYSNQDLDRFIWGTVGGPLSRLGRHQDTNLIGGSDDASRDAA